MKAESQRDICIPMFMEALLTTVKRQKQRKCPSTDEWISKIGYVHILEYYAALKRKEKMTPFQKMDGP